MSRYAHNVNENTVVEYGFDQAGFPGYFYSVTRQGELVEAGDTRKMMITEEKEEYMNRSQIAERLQELGVNDEHVTAMAMDQPF